MTFAARTFQGMPTLPGVIQPGLSVTSSNTGLTTGFRSASFTLVNDGTITKVSGSGSTSWFIPTSTGVGTSVWVRMTVNSTANTTLTGSTGSWLNLSGGNTWSFQNSATNLEGTGTYTLDFATDSGGLNRVGSGTGGWDVGYTP
jgi:hypothetical protein